jgi:LmbE family N-acetylglucosaminyl deacetylase
MRTDSRPRIQQNEQLTLKSAAYPCLLPIIAYTPEATHIGRLTLGPLSPDEIKLAAGLDGSVAYGELVERAPSYRDITPFLDHLVWWDRPLRNQPYTSNGAPCLVISPHPDDAEFSMGGLLVKQRDNQEFVNAICFSQVAYTQFPDAFPSACEVTAVRRSESRMAAAMLGLRCVDFEFPDFELRSREIAEEEFAEREQDVENLLRIALHRLIAEMKPREIFAPAAVGNHPDHRLIFKIILDFFDANRFPGTRFHFYEDIPYSASYYEIDTFLARFETSYVTVRPWVEEISPVLDLKKTLCEVYRSQASPGLPELIERIAVRTAEFLLLPDGRSSVSLSAAERFWTLEESVLLAD